MVTTTRDALLAEILGDVGKLHDSVDELNRKIPGVVNQLDTAGQAFQAVLWQRLSIAVFAAFVAGLAGVTTGALILKSRMAPMAPQSAALTDEQKLLIDKGRAVEKVLPKLDEKTRKKVTDALNS